MKIMIVTLFAFACSSFTTAQNIYTVAGNYTYGAGFSGDGSPATAAELDTPYGLAIDVSGNIYIGDASAEVVRMVNTSGIISTIAGIPMVGGYSGDGVAATTAEFHQIEGLWFDKKGNLYVANARNLVVRMINTSGIISTVAGNNSYSQGYSGDGGPATSAEVNFPWGGFSDARGDFYIADAGNSVVRMVDTMGIITTVAGNHTAGAGYSGDGGAATSAEINNPTGVLIDGSGNLLIADQANNVIRSVNTSGIINTLGGDYLYGRGYSGDGGPATAAEFFNPEQFATDAAGNLFVADYFNYVIREINTSGIISTVAGNNSYGTGFSGDGGPATAAEMTTPSAVVFNSVGNMFIADQRNSVVREVKFVTTSVDQLNDPGNNVSVFPNPGNGKFAVKLSVVSKQWTVEVFNVLGAKVYSSNYPLTSNSYSLDLTNQPNGIYFYRVIANTGNVLGEGKLVIQK